MRSSMHNIFLLLTIFSFPYVAALFLARMSRSSIRINITHRKSTVRTQTSFETEAILPAILLSFSAAIRQIGTYYLPWCSLTGTESILNYHRGDHPGRLAVKMKKVREEQKSNLRYHITRLKQGE